MKQLTVGLVGNPNSGKTTIFNALTDGHQRVGNWPGVTVERLSGFFSENNKKIEVVDLPGVYSLTVVSEVASIDERIASDYILTQKPDVIVNILDASNLERHLYLTLQLAEMGVPIIIAVNMMDIAKQRGIKIDLEKLQKELGFPVVALEAHKGRGINELKNLLVKIPPYPPKDEESPSPPFEKGGQGEFSRGKIFLNEGILHDALLDLSAQTNSYFQAIRLLEDDIFAQREAALELKTNVIIWQHRIREELGEDADILLADSRYRYIQTLLSLCVHKTVSTKKTWTARIDNIVLNRWLGIPIFLGVMYCMFFFAINIGGAFQDFFDISSHTIFVDGFAYLLNQCHLPAWFIALFSNGIGKGINTTLTFIPVIGAMFLFLAFLEDSGYMARAAFVVDRLMQLLGLPGKSFVPMIIGFGCNVPAVMAARTLENNRDRLLTVLMAPFMSCSARLAIYAVFTAAFFPVGGQNIIFLLYLIGIGMAMFTGALLRKTLIQGDPAPLVMELPVYHIPNLKTIFLLAWQRLKGFVYRAGKLIIPICILLGTLNALNWNGSIVETGDTHSLLSTLGKILTPVFAPMGIHQDNWPATVGLVTGVLAKEVVIGTLNTLYSQLGHFALATQDFHFWGNMREAFMSIPHNLAALGSSLSNPVLAKAPVHNLSQHVYGFMAERFDGRLGAIAYLLFVLLYFPCVSTIAVMLREVNKSWTLFSVLWSTGVAYCVSVFFYQATTWVSHPVSSSLWLFFISCTITFVVMTVVKAGGKTYEFA